MHSSCRVGPQLPEGGAVPLPQVQASCLCQPSRQLSSQLEGVTPPGLSRRHQAAACWVVAPRNPGRPCTAGILANTSAYHSRCLGHSSLSACLSPPSLIHPFVRVPAWRRPFQSQELLEPDHFCPPPVATARCLHAQGFEPLEPRPRPTDPAVLEAEGARPLVVGYVSPDLCLHSVSYFAEAPLTWHRRQVVSHIVYSCVTRPDAKTAKLKAATLAAGGQWRDVAGLSEHELATMVRGGQPAGHSIPVLSTCRWAALLLQRHATSPPAAGAAPKHSLAPLTTGTLVSSCRWEPALLPSRAQCVSGAAVLAMTAAKTGSDFVSMQCGSGRAQLPQAGWALLDLSWPSRHPPVLCLHWCAGAAGQGGHPGGAHGAHCAQPAGLCGPAACPCAGHLDWLPQLDGAGGCGLPADG